MRIECGPVSDRRSFDLELPEQTRLGVFVSGGIDSALLYYALCLLNQQAGNTHRIIPLTVLRKEGSKFHALPVINHIHSILGLPKCLLTIVGDNTLAEDQQVRSGVIEALERKNLADVVYVGVIDTLDIHMIGWQPIPANETARFKTPLKHLNKSHIIDLAYEMDCVSLLKLSHSCIRDKGRCYCCNGCNERTWAFEQLGRDDPGSI
jgi:hypothetical protein